MKTNLNGQLVVHVVKGDFHVGSADNPDDGFDLQLLTNLQKEMVWEVLLKLPYSVKLRLGTVSKSWHSRLLSKASLRSSFSTALPSPSPPICVLEYIEDCEICVSTDIRQGDKPSVNCKAYELDFSFLPEEWSQWCSSDFFIQEGLIGLVRGTFTKVRDLNINARSEPSELSSLQICLLNPMTRTWRNLPALTFEDPKEAWIDRDQQELMYCLTEGQKWRIKLQVDRRSVSSGKVQFELIIILPLPGSVWEDMSKTSMSVSRICTYSSLTDKWSVIKSDEVHTRISSPRTLCHRFIYTLRDHQSLTTHSLLDGTVCGEYDLLTLHSVETLHHLGTCWFQCWCDRRQFLVEHRGDVLCVQDIPTGVDGFPTFGIWELNPTSMKWSKLTMLPRVVLDRFLAQMCRRVASEYYLRAVNIVGNFVCLSICDPCVMQRNDTEDLVHVLLCHIPTRRWQIGFNNLLFTRLDRRLEFFEPRLDIFL